jgi:hypothetical protein
MRGLAFNGDMFLQHVQKIGNIICTPLPCPPRPSLFFSLSYVRGKFRKRKKKVRRQGSAAAAAANKARGEERRGE